MHRLKFKHVAVLILILFAVLYILLTFGGHRKNVITWETYPSNKRQLKKEIVVTVVTCETRLEETLTMIKSVLYFSNITMAISFKIITEEVLKSSITKQLEDWQTILTDRFSFEILSLKFPNRDEAIWRTLFKPCAAQRIFLPSLLGNTDATIYVDTDIIFLSPASNIWDHFNNFNSSHIAGLAPEHEDVNIGWYNRFARHPYFGKLGVNSGVMLMNLTKMREFKWENKILSIYNKYKSQITWGDQDLINIVFALNPDKLYIFSCIYNYRPDHCMYMSVCNITEKVRILHGNRSYFHSDKQPIFRLIYETFKNSQINDKVTTFTMVNFKHIIDNIAVTNSTCGKIITNFGLMNN